MKFISNTAIIVGLIISALSACCIDSPGAYGYAVGLMYVAGMIIAGTGYAIRLILERRERKRIRDVYETLGKDRLDADVEFIDLEVEK